jgi:hypothetical protein
LRPDQVKPKTIGGVMVRVQTILDLRPDQVKLKTIGGVMVRVQTIMV